MKRDTGSSGMSAAVYDPNSNGIVDKAEAVREVVEFPASPVAGELVHKDGKLYQAVTT